MTHAVQQQARPTRFEQAAMTALVDRLAVQFPELPREDIVRSVQGRYADFDASRVRDFVPVLVERAVRTDLRTAAPRHRA